VLGITPRSFITWSPMLTFNEAKSDNIEEECPTCV
jgi:hypothetical protein